MTLLPNGAPSPSADLAPAGIDAPQRVMVIDDSPTALLMVEGLLKDSHFEIQGFSDGPSALEQMETYQPDLVVLDILMPGMDGFEVCRRIRAMEGGMGLPILFLTGDERTQTQAEAIAAGGDDLVYKPAIQRELVIRARSLLRIRKLQTALERESRSLKDLQARQEGLFRFIVHDLKSPLQTILSGAEILAEDPAAPAETQKMAGHILQGSLTMERMVQDILVVCHQGNLTPLHQPIRLWEALDQWAEGVQTSFRRRKVTLRNEVPRDLVVQADLELLRRCILNLLDNAAKYGPPGNDVRIEARLDPQTCELRISDQGPGIPPGMEEMIFDPFARLERDAPLARVSSGLGLAFCREVATAHGGRIWVEPGEPSGAVFCLTLPHRE
ncbi:hybrid sensor histidine kinase/response regulator [Geothrix limicola]|uniref:histidine kinase n=1 Tax=Geothrix limicola TaxID=2927978 RepID=A0ABQ5QAM7_9BACT|nr:hybrid sensor histidine kinase/response regulator [Geothrix limicola]GLH71738.1 hybrid sensor histidine kinase/response regulator [Geothrix limicola]